MDDWLAMFGWVQSIARAGVSLQGGLEQVTKFALDNPSIFDEPDYWARVQSHDFRPAFDVVVGWAREGLESMETKPGWEFNLLDLGDCPETFRLYSPGGQSLMFEGKVKELLSRELIVSPDSLGGCFSSNVANPFDQLFGTSLVELADYGIDELQDTILSWNEGSESYDFHGNNGYLLWLLLGSLALIAPLQSQRYCQKILNGRDRLYLLSGYEEIFCPLATVTPNGISYE